MKPAAPALLAAAAGLSLSSLAAAGPVEVIYTKKAGHPKAVVPGTVDLTGAPEPTEWRAIEDLILSPDGSQWLIRGRTQQNADHDTLVVKGSGNTGAMILQEGRPAPFGNAADWIDFFPSGFGRFDDSNNFVLGIRARTTQTGSTVAADANRVLKWNGTSFSLAFKQLDLYSGLQDNPIGNSGDETVGNSVGSYHLLNNGTIGSQDSTINNISSTRRPAITYDRALFHQINNTTVNPGPFGSGPLTWSSLDANEFYTTPDGAHWYAEGRIVSTSTADDGVLTYDGAVVLREGSPIPSTSITVGDFSQTVLTGNGDLYSRGRDNSGTGSAAPDWAVRNGVLLAKTADPLFPGSSDRWGDTFYAIGANRVGDYIIVGNSDHPDPALNDVVVLNGTEVVLREGDPVDLDGNGQFDDDAFIGRGVNTNAAFNPNTWFLTDDRVLYGVVMLRNSAGQDLNSNPVFGTPQAFVRIPLTTAPPPCYANCDGSTTEPILNVNDFICFQTKFAAQDPSANCDGSTTEPVLNVNDFICFQTQYAAGCP